MTPTESEVKESSENVSDKLDAINRNLKYIRKHLKKGPCFGKEEASEESEVSE